jgi:hypothetical protein
VSTSKPRTPNAATLTLLKSAALHRAGGQTWAQVAKKVNRKVSTCEKWPLEHKDIWPALYAEASALVWDEAEAKARSRAVELLDSDDERIQQNAAASLMMAAAKARPKRMEHSGPDGGPIHLYADLPGLVTPSEVPDGE